MENNFEENQLGNGEQPVAEPTPTPVEPFVTEERSDAKAEPCAEEMPVAEEAPVTEDGHRPLRQFRLRFLFRPASGPDC